MYSQERKGFAVDLLPRMFCRIAPKVIPGPQNRVVFHASDLTEKWKTKDNEEAHICAQKSNCKAGNLSLELF